MKYTKEQIKDTICQLVDMMGDYDSHKMSFDVDTASVYPFTIIFYRSSDKHCLSYNFYHRLSLRLNMEGLKEWMADNGLV